MLFNSIEFLFFFPCFFILYWFVFNKKIKQQNLLILFGSYFFYGWWDYRFLALIILSTIVDYTIGLKMHDNKNYSNKKLLLWVSIIFNLSVLGFFKYYNFFIESWIDFIGLFGYELASTWSLKIILPVGISFYTFQTMSYTIDIYKKEVIPTKDFISFAAFVAFFPQLVAGPIERAKNLLPQILIKREFNYNQSVSGLKLILNGMFKKVVIADSLAPIVDNIFLNYSNLDGGILLLGSIYFSIQIYCDFSGYSDIAIGISKLFGFEIMSNFKFPYFSRNIGEFWRRWHISLSSWFRDYLYIPLGGSRKGQLNSLRNIFIIFTVSGLWHGANLTFVFWGLFHAILFIPSFIFKTNRKYQSAIVAEGKLLPKFKDFNRILITFSLVTFGWIFFRSESILDAFKYIEIMFSDFNIPKTYLSFLVHVVLILILDWNNRYCERFSINTYGVFKHPIYFIKLFLIIIYFFQHSVNFIYFQF